MGLEHFGLRLRGLREANGLTQQQLAQIVGIRSGGISALERGEKRPSLDVLIAICQHFEVSSDYMLDLCPEQLALKMELRGLTEAQENAFMQLLGIVEQYNQNKDKK